ncbi:MAG: Uma2 family endonuclease [Runella sp.]
MVITDINQLDPNGSYTYTDYMSWRFDEYVELIKGKIFRMSPAPTVKHQKISMRLTGRLYNALPNNGCQLFAAPFDVRLDRNNKKKGENERTVVQPDLCVICDASKLDEQGCDGAPDLIIEILSPGNSKKEMKDKFAVYEESGVREYWLVHPTEKTVIVYTLNEQGQYIGSRPYTDDDTLTTPIIPALELVLHEVFED